MAAVGQNRFGELSPDEIQKLLDNATAKSTMKATKFGMKIFNGKFCYEVIRTVIIEGRKTVLFLKTQTITMCSISFKRNRF